MKYLISKPGILYEVDSPDKFSANYIKEANFQDEFKKFKKGFAYRSSTEFLESIGWRRVEINDKSPGLAISLRPYTPSQIHRIDQLCKELNVPDSSEVYNMEYYYFPKEIK